MKPHFYVAIVLGTIGIASLAAAAEPVGFPYKLPDEKPDRPLSVAMERLYIQYAPDAVSFRIAAVSSLMPVAAGPYVPDAFTDTRDGRGITWGGCHITDVGTRETRHSILARFDCGLSRDVNDPAAVDSMMLLPHLRLTHRSAKLERYALALGRLLPQLLQDPALRVGPFVCAVAEFVGFPATRVVERMNRERRSDLHVIGGLFSPACYIDQSFPAVLYLAARYSHARGARQQTQYPAGHGRSA